MSAIRFEFPLLLITIKYHKDPPFIASRRLLDMAGVKHTFDITIPVLNLQPVHSTHAASRHRF